MTPDLGGVQQLRDALGIKDKDPSGLQIPQSPSLDQASTQGDLEEHRISPSLDHPRGSVKLNHLEPYVVELLRMLSVGIWRTIDSLTAGKTYTQVTTNTASFVNVGAGVTIDITAGADQVGRLFLVAASGTASVVVQESVSVALTVSPGTAVMLIWDGAAWDQIKGGTNLVRKMLVLNSSQSWVCPNGVNLVEMVLIGGGGGGGGANGGVGTTAGGGGGTAKAIRKLMSVTPGTSYPFVAGAAGTAGTTAGTAGGTGGNSTFLGETAYGGGGGGAGETSAKGAGGGGSGGGGGAGGQGGPASTQVAGAGGAGGAKGQFGFAGGAGGAASAAGGGGGGGSIAGTAGATGDGGDGYPVTFFSPIETLGNAPGGGRRTPAGATGGGAGGSGWGGGANSPSATGAGSDGLGPGSGGSGGISSAANSKAGGAGVIGQLILMWEEPI